MGLSTGWLSWTPSLPQPNVKIKVNVTCWRNCLAACSRPAAISTSVYCWAHHLWRHCSTCRVIPSVFPCVNSHSTAPTYNRHNTGLTRWSHSQQRLILPRRWLSHHLWANSLPTTVTSATPMASFKRKLKTFLLTKISSGLKSSTVYHVLEALLLMQH